MSCQAPWRTLGVRFAQSIVPPFRGCVADAHCSCGYGMIPSNSLTHTLHKILAAQHAKAPAQMQLHRSTPCKHSLKDMRRALGFVLMICQHLNNKCYTASGEPAFMPSTTAKLSSAQQSMIQVRHIHHCVWPLTLLMVLQHLIYLHRSAVQHWHLMPECPAGHLAKLRRS